MMVLFTIVSHTGNNQLSYCYHGFFILPLKSVGLECVYLWKNHANNKPKYKLLDLPVVLTVFSLMLNQINKDMHKIPQISTGPKYTLMDMPTETLWRPYWMLIQNLVTEFKQNLGWKPTHTLYTSTPKHEPPISPSRLNSWLCRSSVPMSCKLFWHYESEPRVSSMCDPFPYSLTNSSSVFLLPSVPTFEQLTIFYYVVWTGLTMVCTKHHKSELQIRVQS